MRKFKIVYIIIWILTLLACSKKESNLFEDHLSYFQLIGLNDYSNFDLIVIVDSQGCMSCEDLALDFIENNQTKQTIKIIDLGQTPNKDLGQEVLIDSNRVYYTFPFIFEGLTVIDTNSEKVFYPLFDSTVSLP